jgi:hypothetical protein
MNESGPGMSRGRLLGVAAVVGLLVIVLAAYAASNRPGGGQTQASPTPSAKTSDAAGASPSVSPAASPATLGEAAGLAYRNGTYAATGRYQSPGGAQTLAVRLTIQGDVVTAAEATEGASDSRSRSYQERFLSGYKAQVEGKRLDELNVTHVSGSSLTPKGFHDAVRQIKDQAKT